jgi:hypothetical protein
MKYILLTILLASCATNRYNKKEPHQIATYKYLDEHKVYCLSVDTIKKYKYKVLNPKTFKSNQECSKSEQYKLTEKKFYANLEKSRIKAIKNYVQSNPKSKKYESVAIAKKVKMGMPEALLYLSWGNPKDTNETVTRWGVSKQLIYPRNYIYIRKGVVSSWQSK